MIEWRKANVPPNILDADPNEPVYRALCPHSNHKFDKKGRPIYIEKTGQISLPKLLKHLSPETIITRHIRQQEIAMKRMGEEGVRRGEHIDKQLIILDLKGLSLMPNQTGINIFKETVRIDQVSKKGRAIWGISECFYRHSILTFSIFRATTQKH